MIFKNTQKASILRSIITIAGTVMVATGHLDAAHLDYFTNTIMMVMGSLLGATAVVAGVTSKEDA